MPDKKSRVLIVDDAPENIRMLVESLKENYVIMVSKDGESALRLALAEPSPDCIILDVVMPGMDGYEVCRRLKESRQTRDIPVIFITSQSDELDEARGLALGAVDYITKPFRSTLVMTRIANQIELKQHRDSLSNQIYERTHELALTREVTIEALATLAEWRDPETGGHIKRTQSYVRALAEQLHIMPHYAELINDEYIELLYLSAPLHDVGKVSMPDDILLKPASLTPDEFAEIKKHTTRGREALATAEKKLGGNSFLRLACEIAYGHHERWDGHGYPQGLVGSQIPLSAQLMAVADVYDALISERVYKAAVPPEIAAQIIIQGKGSQFAPDVVDAFIIIQDNFQAIARHFLDDPVLVHQFND